MKKVVVIGGGSGIFNVLKGLKQYPLEITSIVTMFDNGGSTGILRDEFGTLPQGDIRRSLVALAPDTGDSILRDMLSYRFPEESSLVGHSFGNLFLQALMSITGSEVGAVKKAADILNIKHRILPISTDNAHLAAELSDGTIVRGETNIDIPKHNGDLAIRRLFLEPSATIYSESYDAIKNADLIVIGPGDLYTSILPNILSEGFTQALLESKGKVAYITNIMTKWGETTGFAAHDFAKTLLAYLGKNKLDYLFANNGSVNTEYLSLYAEQKSYPVKIDETVLSPLVEKLIMEDYVLLSETERLVRHDPQKIARAIMNILK